MRDSRNKAQDFSIHFAGLKELISSQNKPVVKDSSKSCCEICDVELTATTASAESYESSQMAHTHCGRCYRHELIFDIEWPTRKIASKVGRTSKSANRLPSNEKTKKSKKSTVEGKIPNLSQLNSPTVVWVDPDDSSLPYWWPGIVCLFVIIFSRLFHPIKLIRLLISSHPKIMSLLVSSRHL